MSFYMTLTNEKGNFPNNTNSTFSTLLDPPLILDGPYKVAIVELTYPVTYKVALGNTTFSKKSLRPITKEFEVNDRMLVAEFIPVLTSHFNIHMNPKINISIMDMFGRRIQFVDNYSRVIVKLHFRKNESQ